MAKDFKILPSMNLNQTQLDIKGTSGGEAVLTRNLEFERLTAAWTKHWFLGHEPAVTVELGCLSDGTISLVELEKKSQPAKRNYSEN